MGQKLRVAVSRVRKVVTHNSKSDLPLDMYVVMYILCITASFNWIWGLSSAQMGLEGLSTKYKTLKVLTTNVRLNAAHWPKPNDAVTLSPKKTGSVTSICSFYKTGSLVLWKIYTLHFFFFFVIFLWTWKLGICVVLFSFDSQLLFFPSNESSRLLYSLHDFDDASRVAAVRPPNSLGSLNKEPQRCQVCTFTLTHTYLV